MRVVGKVQRLLKENHQKRFDRIKLRFDPIKLFEHLYIHVVSHSLAITYYQRKREANQVFFIFL